jgi:hypothetical protein
MQKTEEKFSLIFKYMGIPTEEIRMDASFVKDFEFEEFQMGYLVFYVGSYFRINFRESEYPELDTIGSSMDFVRRKLKKRDHLKISRRKNRPVETLKSVPMIVRQPINKNLVGPHLTYRPLVPSGSII